MSNMVCINGCDKKYFNDISDSNEYEMMLCMKCNTRYRDKDDGILEKKEKSDSNWTIYKKY